MDSYNNASLNIFRSPKNVHFLRIALIQNFDGNPQVVSFVNSSMSQLMASFTEMINRDFMYSGNMRNMDTRFSPRMQVSCLNKMFLDDKTGFISRWLLTNKNYRKCGVLADSDYLLTDGYEVTQHTPLTNASRQVVDDKNTRIVNRVHQTSSQCATTDEVLDGWRYPRRGRELRDDSHGDRGSNDCKYKVVTNPRDGRGLPAGSYKQTAGVEVGLPEEIPYDHVGVLMSSAKIQQLNDYSNGAEHARRREGLCNEPEHNYMTNVGDHQNNIKLYAQGDGFVDIDDKKKYNEYLTKRTFRSYNSRPGVTPGDDADAQIPWWRKAIHSRNYERDVDETLPSAQFDYQQRGFDMSGLHCRVNTRRMERINEEENFRKFDFKDI